MTTALVLNFDAFIMNAIGSSPTLISSFTTDGTLLESKTLYPLLGNNIVTVPTTATLFKLNAKHSVTGAILPSMTGGIDPSSSQFNVSMTDATGSASPNNGSSISTSISTSTGNPNSSVCTCSHCPTCADASSTLQLVETFKKKEAKKKNKSKNV